MITIRNPNNPNAIKQGSKDHPLNVNDHLFGPIIKEVHWIGGWGVLTIDFPQGQNVFLDSHSAWNPFASSGIAVVTDQVITPEAVAEIDSRPDAAIYDTSFDHSLDGETLYDVPVSGYLYQTPAEVTVPAGADASASISATLALFPGALQIKCEGSSLQNPPFGTTTSMTDLVSPICGSAPFNPGFDNYFFYFITPISDHVTRKATRKVWLIDFTKWKSGETVQIVNTDTSPDTNLPSYNTTVQLTIYNKSIVLKGAPNTIVGVPPGTPKVITSPYTAASLGFVSRNSIAR